MFRLLSQLAACVCLIVCLLGCENQFISGRKLATMGVEIDFRGPRPLEVQASPLATPRPDADGDGLADEEEYLVGRPNSLVTQEVFVATIDSDNDGILNWQDPDSDNDGILDGEDPSPTDRYHTLGPTFAVWWANSPAGAGQFTTFPNTATQALNPDLRVFTNANIGITAQIRKLPDDEWELTIQNTGPNHIQNVTFPYPIHKTQLNHSTEDDRLYHPFRMGKVSRMKDSQGRWLSDFTSNDISLVYPGNIVSPLTILADATEARIVASTTFPPKAVSPYWDMKRQYLRFVDAIPSGSTESFRVLVKNVSGDALQGLEPWQLAADAYKARLKAWMGSENLDPQNLPSWMKSIHGWLAVGGQNYIDFRQNNLESQWNRWKGHFPWVQVWGQMSNHPGPNQFPAPDPFEVFGCCTGFTDLHPRYTEPSLLGTKKSFPEFAQSVTNEGGHFGYYSRPRMTADPGLQGPNEPYLMDSSDVLPGVSVTAEEYLVSWMTKQRDQWGANAYYIDVLACERFATNTMYVPGLFLSRPALFSTASHECQMDYYPTLGLMSGALFLSGNGVGGEFDSLASQVTVSHVMFGRYFLDDHLLLMGHSNNDHIYYGKKNHYWGERQTFLLGMKLDIGFNGLVDSGNSSDLTGPMNTAVRQTIESRDALMWWDKEARFLATKGLTYVPTDVRVTRFESRSGKTFLAIDNYRASLARVSVAVDGVLRTYPIPVDGVTGKPKMLILCPLESSDGQCQ